MSHGDLRVLYFNSNPLCLLVCWTILFEESPNALTSLAFDSALSAVQHTYADYLQVHLFTSVSLIVIGKTLVGDSAPGLIMVMRSILVFLQLMHLSFNLFSMQLPVSWGVSRSSAISLLRNLFQLDGPTIAKFLD